MNDKIARKKAFTLVELAVAMAVTVVFLALVTVLLANVLDEKEDTNKDALIAYEMLLVESRVESFYSNFSQIDPEQAEWAFSVDQENPNKLIASRTVEEVTEEAFISYDSERKTLESTDRERITEFKEIKSVVFEIVNQNGVTAIRVTVAFESLKTPVVRLFVQGGVNYA